MAEIFDCVAEQRRLSGLTMQLGRAVGAPAVQKLTEVVVAKDERIGWAHWEHRRENGNLIVGNTEKLGRAHQFVWHLEAPTIGAEGLIFWQTEGSLKLRNDEQLALFGLRPDIKIDDLVVNSYAIHVRSTGLVISNSKPIFVDGKYTYTFEQVPITTEQFDEVESQVLELANYVSSLEVPVDLQK
ncbi:MAG: hypothetical protein JWO47_1088 [Candidatus Saccharibacteria bacterium]|nr:hypothetical protein [Candidatus Saccharibacteria bacterium]